MYMCVCACVHACVHVCVCMCACCLNLKDLELCLPRHYSSVVMFTYMYVGKYKMYVYIQSYGSHCVSNEYSYIILCAVYSCYVKTVSFSAFVLLFPPSTGTLKLGTAFISSLLRGMFSLLP